MYAKNGFYPKGVGEKLLNVISFGIPRSGSTFVYQVLCDIFGVGVAKTHGYMTNTAPVVMTYRDLRDCIMSLWLVRGGQSPIPHKKINWIWLHEVKPSFDALMRYMKERSGNTRSWCTMKYESFTEKPMSIWTDLDTTALSNAVSALTDEQRQKCVRAHSKDANAEIAKQYKGFGQYDRVSHIHGNHMAGGGIGTWQQNADCTGRQILTELTRAANEILGYKVT